MTVRHFSVDYKEPNGHGPFSPGDTISGQVTVVTSRKIKVQCLLVKAKGKAQVGWCEGHGRGAAVCSDKRKYFHLEHIILQDKNKGDGPCRSLLIFKIQDDSRLLNVSCLCPPTPPPAPASFSSSSSWSSWLGSEIIRRGRNVYAFTFVIPNTYVC